MFNYWNDLDQFLEVRLYWGADVISFIYSPSVKPVGGERDEIIGLEDGWYLCDYRNVPLKLNTK